MAVPSLTFVGGNWKIHANLRVGHHAVTSQTYWQVKIVATSADGILDILAISAEPLQNLVQ